jgi:LPXTG-site transpeptidase (sortase) family protein
MNRRPRPAVIVLVISSLLLIGSLIWLSVAGSLAGSPTVSSVGDRQLATVSAPPSSTPGSDSPDVLDPQRLPEPVPPPPDPMSIQIPDIGVTAKIVPTGVDKQNSVVIPEDIMKVGWYEPGVAPGSDEGSAVIVGHRDGVVQGHGAFYSIGVLNVGDKIIVTNRSGEKLKYRVIAREAISKKKLPTDELFSTTGAPRLTLITCGGYYDKANGGYQDNVVVTAVPVATPA